MIKITEAHERLFVSMPFALKADFRQNFPRSIWHPEDKQWSVANEFKARLEQWSSVANTIDIGEQQIAATTALMSQADIERTLGEIEAAKNKLAVQASKRESDEAIKAKLAISVATLRKLKDEIAAVAAEMAFEIQEAEEKEAEIDAAISPLIDREACQMNAAVMARRESANASASEKTEWQAAQDEIIKARNVLKNANISLEAIDFLAQLRHGRASIRSIPPGAWHALTRYN